MKPDPDDQYTCKRCKATVMLHDGMEPTDYCDGCAQDLVIDLQTLLTAEKEASGRMREALALADSYIGSSDADQTQGLASEILAGSLKSLPISSLANADA